MRVYRISSRDFSRGLWTVHGPTHQAGGVAFGSAGLYSPGLPAVLAESFRGFPHNLEINAGVVFLK